MNIPMFGMSDPFNWCQTINPCQEVLNDTLEERRKTELWLNQFIGLGLLNYKGDDKMSKFSINDEISIIKSKYEVLIGKEGVIKDIIQSSGEEDRYGIEFTEDLLLHDMNGKAGKGRGWYVYESEIDVINKSKLCRMIVKDEELIHNIKTINGMNVKGVVYNIRTNGALTFLTLGSTKILAFNSSTSKVLLLNCKSEEDKIAILHLMDVKRFLPMITLNDKYEFVLFTQAESDKLEDEMFAIKIEKVVEPVIDPVVKDKIKKAIITKPESKEQFFDDEDALYASLGITKKD